MNVSSRFDSFRFDSFRFDSPRSAVAAWSVVHVRRAIGVAALTVAAAGLPASPAHSAPLVDESAATNASTDVNAAIDVLKLGAYGLTSGQCAAFLSAVPTADPYAGDRPVAPATWFGAIRMVNATIGFQPSAPGRSAATSATSRISMESGWHGAAFHGPRSTHAGSRAPAIQDDWSAPGALGGSDHDAGDVYLRYHSARHGVGDESDRTRLKDLDAFMLSASFPVASADRGSF